jgi:hypothetical protein
VVSSKNKGILLRSRDDIISTGPLDFACKIGESWFDFVEDMQTKGLLEAYKAELGNKTLVGEYIGN